MIDGNWFASCKKGGSLGVSFLIESTIVFDQSCSQRFIKVPSTSIGKRIHIEFISFISVVGRAFSRCSRLIDRNLLYKFIFLPHNELIAKQGTDLISFIVWIACKYRGIYIFFTTKLSSYDKIFFYPTGRDFDELTIVFGRVIDFKSLFFFVQKIELVEVDSAVYGQNFLISDVGICKHTERKSSYRIRRYRGDIDQYCHDKPACLDEYPCNQGLFDNPQRGFFIFDRSSSWSADNTFYNRKKHHKSQRKVSKIFHHIPKFPERSIEMKEWCIDQSVVHSESRYHQQRSEKDIDKLENNIQKLKRPHNISCSFLIFIIYFRYWSRTFCVYFANTDVAIQKNPRTSHDDKRSEYFLDKTRF